MVLQGGSRDLPQQDPELPKESPRALLGHQNPGAELSGPLELNPNKILEQTRTRMPGSLKPFCRRRCELNLAGKDAGPL